MKMIKGIENLKDEWRKAKIACGDFRGLSNRFELAERFKINPTQILFDSVSKINSKEITGEIRSAFDYEVGESVYNLSGLIEAIKQASDTKFEICIYCLTWNKYHTDADSKTVLEFEFEK